MSMHSTAVVDPQAQIGRDVEIGPCCFVGPHVVIHDRCKLHHHAAVEGYTTIGESCEIYPQAVIGAAPQDIKYSGERTNLEIGKNNIFREMVTVHPGTANGGGVTTIGDNGLFLIGTHIAHDCHIGNNCILANYVQVAGHVHVEDNVNMGGHSAVHHFVTIGKHAFIGGMTRVSADVPPFMVVVAARGTRSEVRMINGVGLQRSGYSNEEINSLKDAYMQIFSRRARLSGVAIRDRVQALLDAECHSPNVKYLCEFLMRSFAHGRHGRYLESLRADPVHRDSWKIKNSRTLTVNILGRGTVRRGNAGTTKDEHEIFELTAKPHPGWAFTGWDGGFSGPDNPANIIVDDDKTVIANFTEKP
ncbi:MAG: acyl-ACP--UDP-N-acetylglucosamine O-acyltransferase [Planctomycetes bacterium]|nr:acyl-ACP--UDP-N-acetylglucosamine O-acyltransferase [Planctomycetota bacterium]